MLACSCTRWHVGQMKLYKIQIVQIEMTVHNWYKVWALWSDSGSIHVFQLVLRRTSGSVQVSSIGSVPYHLPVHVFRFVCAWKTNSLYAFRIAFFGTIDIEGTRQTMCAFSQLRLCRRQIMWFASKNYSSINSAIGNTNHVCDTM